MLHNRDVISAVNERIGSLQIPTVLDPVSISRAGSKLLEDSAIEELKKLFYSVNVITPNIHEAKEFFAVETDSFEESLKRLKEASKEYKSAILLKQFPLKEDFSSDILVIEDNYSIFETDRIKDIHPHGTGCTLSSAIASNLANGLSLMQSVGSSKNFVYEAIKLSDIYLNHKGAMNALCAY
jgi:hydroxymethylpyrimidine/phosphomethylpyrimidine kinase